MKVTGATDATGTNRYFYVDDVNVAYPAGVAIDLGNLDLWAEGLPVAPAIATMPSITGVWDEPLSAHTIAGSAGEILSNADTSAIPALVWGYSDQTTSPNTMGQRQVDAADSAELASIT